MKANSMRTALELLDASYKDIMNDYIPTPEVVDASEAVRDLAKKLEQL